MRPRWQTTLLWVGASPLLAVAVIMSPFIIALALIVLPFWCLSKLGEGP